jgi:hypothetical protein
VRIVILPFYSQQNKLTGKFLLSTCGAAKQLAFLAEKLTEDGHQVTAIVPSEQLREDEHPFKCGTFSAYIPPDNAMQQVHWDAGMLRRAFFDADICLCNHEFAAIPVRKLFPKKRIVQMCSVRPDSLVFNAAWAAADLVVAQGSYAAERIRYSTRTPVTAWKLAYDERLFQRTVAGHRDIDVLFIQRCSASNYTHHEEFLAADLSGLRVAYVDVTKYLRKQRPDLEYIEPEGYIDALYRSKVAVALNDNWYGGLSIREAMRAGCTPVVLDAACYHELVGPGWPFVTYLKDIAEVVRGAVASCKYRSIDESYQTAWPKVREDLCSLR